MSVKFVTWQAGSPYVAFGTSADTKPASPAEDSYFIEVDTSIAYVAVSGSWVEVTTFATASDLSAVEADLESQIGAKASSSFTTIAVAGQSNVVADSITDTLTLVAGTNVTITTNSGSDSITINASGGGSGLTQPQVMARTLGC